MKNIVETHSLNKKFGKFVAVDNLNLRIKEGEIYGLLGPNGAGKTTTIRMLCGLLKASSGSMYVLGKEIPNRDIMKSVGYMPQETALYAGLTIHQNIFFLRRDLRSEKRKNSEKRGKAAGIHKFEEMER